MAYTQDELKQQVARAAVEYVKEGIIGVGTGSTANFFIEELAKVKHKIEGAVAVSYTHLDVYKRQAIMAALNLAHELLNTKNGTVDVGDIKRRISHMQDQIDQVYATKELFS